MMQELREPTAHPSCGSDGSLSRVVLFIPEEMEQEHGDAKRRRPTLSVCHPEATFHGTPPKHVGWNVSISVILYS